MPAAAAAVMIPMQIYLFFSVLNWYENFCASLSIIFLSFPKMNVSVLKSIRHGGLFRVDSLVYFFSWDAVEMNYVPWVRGRIRDDNSLSRTAFHDPSIAKIDSDVRVL